MSAYANQVKSYIDRYRAEVGGDGLLDPHEVAAWAYKNGLHGTMSVMARASAWRFTSARASSSRLLSACAAALRASSWRRGGLIVRMSSAMRLSFRNIAGSVSMATWSPLDALAIDRLTSDNAIFWSSVRQSRCKASRSGAAIASGGQYIATGTANVLSDRGSDVRPSEKKQCIASHFFTSFEVEF